MFLLIKKGLSNFFDFIFYKAITDNQRRFITTVLSKEQKKKIKNLFRMGKRQAQIRHIENIKYHLNNLGFEQKALSDLENTLRNAHEPFLKILANHELALWYANQYTVEGAEKCLILLNNDKNIQKLSFEKKRQVAIMLAEANLELGNVNKAFKNIKEILSTKVHPDLYLAAANTEESIDQKIKWINKVYQLYNLSAISLKSIRANSIYDRLNSENPPKKIEGNTAKVTIIIPVYNAEDVIRTSLNSILEQTWANLEVIVVDDCSTDSTKQIIREYTNKDKRVKLIEAKVNGGAYAARNLALQVATGKYVTINDADDWSHPQKIETQVRHLENNSSIIGNTSQQARLTNELKFYRRGKFGIFIFSNMSSFMFRREKVMSEVGFWDAVRFGADSEYIKRIKKVFGEKSIVELQTGPLSFQRQSSSSLTGNSAFGFPGFFMGARKEYVEIQEHYHLHSKNLYYEYDQPRPFPVPEPMLPNKEEKINGFRRFDTVIISDFRESFGPINELVEVINSQKQQGYRVGIIQMYIYELESEKKISSRIRDILDGKQVHMLVYGERIESEKVLIINTTILKEWQKYIPEVKAETLDVIITEKQPLKYEEFNKCQNHLNKYIDFDSEQNFIPFNEEVRRSLLENQFEKKYKVAISKENWA